MTESHVGGEPGSLGEEAARLLEAIEGWARGIGTDRLATGAPECKLCPICLLLSAMRGVQPQTFEHLVDAATSFTAALRSAVEMHAGTPRPGRGVERIDIDVD